VGFRCWEFGVRCFWGSGLWIPLLLPFVLTFEFWCSDSLFDCFSRFCSAKLRKCSSRSHLPPITSQPHRPVPSGAAYVRRENCWHKWRPTRKPRSIVRSPKSSDAPCWPAIFIRIYFYCFAQLSTFTTLSIYEYRCAFRSKDFNYGNAADSDNQRDKGDGNSLEVSFEFENHCEEIVLKVFWGA